MLNNEVSLLGRLTKAAELEVVKKKDGSQGTYAPITLAVDRNKTEADIIPCEVWGNLAEKLCSYTTKGSLIMIKGNIHAEYFETKDGQKAMRLRIFVNEFKALESKEITDQRRQKQTVQNQQNGYGQQNSGNRQSQQSNYGNYNQQNRQNNYPNQRNNYQQYQNQQNQSTGRNDNQAPFNNDGTEMPPAWD